MIQATAGNVFAYLEYAVIANHRLLLLSCYDRSSIAVNGLCANVGLQAETTRIIEDGVIQASIQGPFDTQNYISKVLVGKETVYQGICISDLVKKEFLFIKEGQWKEDFYAYFMAEFELPVLKAWVPYLTKEAMNREFITQAKTEILGNGKKFEQYLIFHSVMTNDDLTDIVKHGLENHMIQIASEEQRPLEFTDVDNYFEKYGHTLVDNLEKILNPLSPMKEIVEELAFISKRPFPQQAAIINGAMERLNHGDYVFLIESMGAGKTLQGMGVVDGWFVSRYRKQHPKMTPKEIYQDGTLVKYRVIIMCPSHLVEKWAASIREEIPYARVEIIEELSQLVALRKRGRNPTGKEYYVISKDSGKLSYTYMPVPYQLKLKKPGYPVCRNCETILMNGYSELCKCGCKEWEIEHGREKIYGLICPECGELLLPAEGTIYDENGNIKALLPEDFAVQNTANRFCRCCRTALWAPTCKLIDDRILFRKPKKKKRKWKKISHFTNRAKKARKSVWVMDSREALYKKENQITDEEVEELSVTGPRRYSMTRYIKKYMKNYFDLAIFDEVQEYKAGGSAQGYAMHDLIRASKKQICLTGTIAAGYASDLFYTLYRLDPARMKAKGYEYGSSGERKFVEKYGTVETVYAVQESGEYHTTTRGKMIVPTRCLPGISVLIFTEFLMGTALFLDLSDLSRYLPDLYEQVVFVPLEPEIRNEYSHIRNELKDYMREEEKGKLLMGSFLQFSLSYSDMPFKRPPILSPATGDIVAEPEDLSYLVEDGRLLLKEQELVERVKKELQEDRNTFIYCEYTGDGEEVITYRLKEILEGYCNLKANEVTVLESSSPQASQREAWMHQKAAQGTKVFITNAKCVSTGLDFAFSYQGKEYNYPTIMFYQTGYDMIKIWQASHRHYRLNQTQECRTFFFVSEYTIQPDAVELIATKEVATSSIQGQFTMEGLATMARGVDARVILAQSMAEKSEQKERGLRKMMDVINERNNQGKGAVSYKMMPIFSELTGITEIPDYEDVFSEFEYVTGQDIMELLNFDESELRNDFIPASIIDVQSVEITETIQLQEETKVFNPDELHQSELAGLLDFIF